jgi:nucleotide-binding universal stress UspA family protein
MSIGALRYAAQFAERNGASLCLLHVVEPAPFTAGMQGVPLAISDKELAPRSEHDLKLLAEREVKPSITARTKVLIGKAHHQIVEAAAEMKVDLIIVSTHGYTGLKHTLLGSTAERVVRHAPCAVLVVR